MVRIQFYDLNFLCGRALGVELYGFLLRGSVVAV
jgi:hypothetical protein